MKLNQLAIAIIAGVSILGQGVAEGGNGRGQLGEVRSIPLSPDAILNEYSTPVIALGGDVGFVSSVTIGSLISFSVPSGRVLSSVKFGKMAGLVSMAEIDKKRIITLPTAEGPDPSRPAVVNIIDASSPERPETVAIVELPAGAHIGPDSRAFITPDGRFGVIAASINQPTLYCFGIESGKVISSLKLPGWPSAMAIYDGGRSKREYMVAVSSAEANMLNIIHIDGQGRLSAGRHFSPAGMRLDTSNNPAFSPDGQVVYIAAFNGEHLFSIDAHKGAVLGMIKLPSAPLRITVARDQAGIDLIGVTREGQPSDKKSGGISLLASNKGQLTVRAEFLLPQNAQLSRANNIVFDADATRAFVGSVTGTVFVFDVKSGELLAHKTVGKEVRGIELSRYARMLVGVRSTPKNDEIAIIALDKAADEEVAAAPQIKRVSSGPAQVHVVIEGSNFSKDAMVEFIKSGNVVSRQTPIIVTENRLAIVVPVDKIEALGRCELRVVSSGKAQSNTILIDPSTLLSGREAGAANATSDPPSKIEIAKTVTAPKIEVARVERPRKVAPEIAEPESKPATEFNSVRTELAGGVFRLLVDTDGEARYRDFTLDAPPRIVVDFEGLTNRFGNKTIQVGKGPVKRVRVGQPEPGIVRVVIDLREPVSYRVAHESGSLIITIGDEP